MRENENIFGGYADVRIRYQGSLAELVHKLASELNLKGMEITSHEEPPYHDVAMGEPFGWDAWLREDGARTGWFRLTLQTQDSVEEILYDRMHDLAPWLARYISETCDLDVIPLSKSRQDDQAREE